MILSFAGLYYSFIIASEVGDRDGIGVEAYEVDSPNDIAGKLLCEVFRDDKRRNVTFTALVENIPFEVVEHACRLARESLADWRWAED